MTQPDHRAIALPDRVTIAHALHCHFVPNHAHDTETIKTIIWIVRRFDLINISQAPTRLPIGIWRAMDKIFPGDLLRSDHRLVRELAQQLEAEKASAQASAAIEEMMWRING